MRDAEATHAIYTKNSKMKDKTLKYTKTVKHTDKRLLSASSHTQYYY